MFCIDVDGSLRGRMPSPMGGELASLGWVFGLERVVWDRWVVRFFIGSRVNVFGGDGLRLPVSMRLGDCLTSGGVSSILSLEPC